MGGYRPRTVLVDDEPLARDRLRELILTSGRAEIVAEARDGIDALDAIQRTRPDIVFLDVEMPELDGLSVAQQICGGGEPLVVFITAYDRYAVAAFETRAVDYLLKPVSAERLAVTLDRVEQSVRERLGGDEWQARLATVLEDLGRSRHLRQLAVLDRGRWIVVPVDTVEWIGAAGNYVELHVEERTWLLRESLSRLATKLDPELFTRVHRGAMVNVAHIREVHPAGHGDFSLLLRSGARLPASRTYATKLKLFVRNFP